MMFKGVDFFPHNTRWKIIKWRYMFVGLSWVLAILARRCSIRAVSTTASISRAAR